MKNLEKIRELIIQYSLDGLAIVPTKMLGTSGKT